MWAQWVWMLPGQSQIIFADSLVTGQASDWLWRMERFLSGKFSHGDSPYTWRFPHFGKIECFRPRMDDVAQVIYHATSARSPTFWYRSTSSPRTLRIQISGRILAGMWRHTVNKYPQTYFQQMLFLRLSSAVAIYNICMTPTTLYLRWAIVIGHQQPRMQCGRRIDAFFELWWWW